MFGFIGSIASSLIGAHSAKQTSQANIEAAREAMQNRHQWEVEDLKKAGLNPILSAHGSTGTTSGSGVAYSPENPFQGFQERQLLKKKTEADLSSAKAYADNLTADAKLKGMEYIKQRSAFYDYLQQQSTNTAIRAQELENARKQGLYLDAQIGSINASSAKDKAFEKGWNKVGDFVSSAVDYSNFIREYHGNYQDSHKYTGQGYSYYGD